MKSVTLTCRCLCGHCSIMPTSAECVCCREISAVVAGGHYIVLFASRCTLLLILPPCASICHYSGTSQIRNTKNHVLIREVPLYYYLIVATIQRLQQCAYIYSEERAKEKECDLIGDWEKSLMNHPLLVCDIYK